MSERRDERLEITLEPDAAAMQLSILNEVRSDHRKGRNVGQSNKADNGAPSIVAVSQRMCQVLETCDLFAGCDEPVLVTGETGTGKELISKRIHAISRRQPGPFVPINCAAVPEELFEREFFGHVRGAFTGSSASTIGYVEKARGGTLFLDEIGELPISMQPKLLRLLEDGSYHRLGDPQIRFSDVRIVAATNYNLKVLVDENRFRADLRFRLIGLEIEIPPLRSRRQDIVPLIRHFLSILLGREVKISEFLDHHEIESVCRHSWPGNARELLALARKLRWRKQLPNLDHEIKRLLDVREESKRIAAKPTQSELILRLERNGGNKAQLARQLGVSRSTVYRWLTA